MSKTGFRKFHISFIDVMAGKLRPSILYIVFSLGMQRERENIFLKIKSVIVCMSL